MRQPLPTGRPLVDQVQPSVNIEAYQPYPVSSRMWSLPGMHRTWLTNVFDWLRVQLDDQKAKKDPEARKAEGAGFFIESSGVTSRPRMWWTARKMYSFRWLTVAAFRRMWSAWTKPQISACSG